MPVPPEENQQAVHELTNKKTELEGELSALRREVDGLEGAKLGTQRELAGHKSSLENLRLVHIRNCNIVYIVSFIIIAVHYSDILCQNSEVALFYFS